MKNLSPYDSMPWLLSSVIILAYLQQVKSTLEISEIKELLEDGLSFLE